MDEDLKAKRIINIESTKNLNKESTEDKEEDQIIDNIVIDFDHISILTSSRLSLQKKSNTKKSLDTNESVKFLNQNQNDNESRKNKKNYCLKNLILFRGSLLAILGAILSSFSTIIIKKTKILSPYEQTTIRYLIQFMVMFIICKYTKENIFESKSHRRLLILRAFLGVTGMTCFYIAIQLITPSDFLTISQSSIFITAIMARIILKEKLAIVHLIGICLTVMGVLFISKPTFLFPVKEPVYNTQNNNFSNQSFYHINETQGKLGTYFLGIIVAMVDAFVLGVLQILIRKLAVQKVHFAVISIYVTFVGIPFSIILSTVLILIGKSNLVSYVKNYSKDLLTEFLYCVLVGVIGAIGQIVLNLSLKYEDASKIAIIKTVDLFFIFILQYIFLNITVDLTNLIGVTLIFSSTLLVMCYRFADERNKKKKKNPKYKESLVNRMLFVKF